MINHYAFVKLTVFWRFLTSLILVDFMPRDERLASTSYMYVKHGMRPMTVSKYSR